MGLGVTTPEEDNILGAATFNNVGGGGGSSSRGRGGAGGRGAGGAGGGGGFRYQESALIRRGILKSGTLRKATARCVGRLETTTWKTKNIELSPGRFAYADGGSVLGKK